MMHYVAQVKIEMSLYIGFLYLDYSCCLKAREIGQCLIMLDRIEMAGTKTRYLYRYKKKLFDLHQDRKLQVAVSAVFFTNLPHYCQILARQEEIPQKTSKNISRYFCSSFQGLV